MKNSKPVVDLDMLVQWTRCPMKIFWINKSATRTFEYESLLRTMLLNTLKAAYREADAQKKPDLEEHSSDIWEYLLKVRKFPKPESLLRKMNDFFDLRSRNIEFLEKKYQDSAMLLNLHHWWDTGLVFDSEYYRLRDEINEFQSFLGFPDWKFIKAYYREHEYKPVSLADAFCDYMIGIRIFSTKNIPPANIRFDVRAYLDLDDITMAVRFDILWRRKKVYKSKSQKMQTGLIAEQLIPFSHFSNAEQIRRERMILKDIQMPLVGVDYTKENGEKFHIDSLSCCTFPAISGTAAWKESKLSYASSELASYLARLNYSGVSYLKAVRQNLFIPVSLAKNETCASCSFIKKCLNSNIPSEIEAAVEEKNTGVFSDLLQKIVEKTSTFADSSRSMDLLIEVLDILKENPSIHLLESLSNAAVNLRQDLSGGKNAKT